MKERELSKLKLIYPDKSLIVSYVLEPPHNEILNVTIFSPLPLDRKRKLLYTYLKLFIPHFLHPVKACFKCTLWSLV